MGEEMALSREPGGLREWACEMFREEHANSEYRKCKGPEAGGEAGEWVRGEHQEVRLNWEKRPHHFDLVGWGRLGFVPKGVECLFPGVFWEGGVTQPGCLERTVTGGDTILTSKIHKVLQWLINNKRQNSVFKWAIVSNRCFTEDTCKRSKRTWKSAQLHYP